MVAMIIMYLVTAIQVVGDLSAITLGGVNREVSDKELSGGVIGNGVAAIISFYFKFISNSNLLLKRWTCSFN